MKVVVVGGNGLIGRALIAALQERNDCEITSIDKDAHSLVGCQCKQVDIQDYEALADNFVGANVVYHKAGILGNARLSTDSKYADNFFDVNINGTANVIAASIAQNVNKIVFDSSVAIYGEQSQARLAREDSFPKPRNFYGFSKVVAERLLYRCSLESSLNVNVLRYSRVRSKESKDVIYHFLKALINGDPVKIFGNPRKQIEFVDINDVVRANLLVSELEIKWGAFNITSGEKISVLELVNLCAVYLGKNDFAIEFIENPLSIDIEPLITEMSTENARNILGFVPSIDLSKMLTATVKSLGN